MERVVLRGVLKGALNAPTSKSYAQRALAASLLTSGDSTLTNIEFCDDTLSAAKSIEILGAELTRVDESTLKVRGGLNPRGSELFIGESGLATRLFTPIASLFDGEITITGHGSILSRPMTMMIEPLRALGVEVYDSNGYLPFGVRGPLRGGEIRVDGSVSSQFISGLLFALPCAACDSRLFVDGAVSLPYIDMTIETAHRFGVEIENHDYQEFVISGGQSYVATDFNVEGDWSSVSTLLVGGAIAGEVTIHNMNMESKQADRAICDALRSSGAYLRSTGGSLTVAQRPLTAFEFDATQCPDLFPALVALAAAGDGVSTLKGCKRLTHKESNRALTLQEEYSKVGIEVELVGDDVMKVRGGDISSAVVSSHNDHRIAMSLAVTALRSDSQIEIHDAESVNKSYPTFFEDLESLR